MFRRLNPYGPAQPRRAIFHGLNVPPRAVTGSRRRPWRRGTGTINNRRVPYISRILVQRNPWFITDCASRERRALCIIYATLLEPALSPGRGCPWNIIHISRGAVTRGPNEYSLQDLQSRLVGSELQEAKNAYKTVFMGAGCKFKLRWSILKRVVFMWERKYSESIIRYDILRL